jgi:hypothetical protein
LRKLSQLLRDLEDLFLGHCLLLVELGRELINTPGGWPESAMEP